jgi:hypothetical protein
MPLNPFCSFSKKNQRLILLLVASHLLWSGGVLALGIYGRTFAMPAPWKSALFMALQLFAAAQLLLPALLLHPEERNRRFYLFWGLTLALTVWLLNLLPAAGNWLHPLAALKSGILLLTATVTGAALARHVHRLWEIAPICIVMTLADFVSWLNGPTATFTQQIRSYYLKPEGPPPLVDMILIKVALPGADALAPLFGIADWIMVAFFAFVARHHGVNDNLLGASGESLARQWKVGRYLPVSVAALLAVVILAQATSLFLPALPLMALIMLLWYAGRHLLLRRVRYRQGGEKPSPD